MTRLVLVLPLLLSGCIVEPLNAVGRPCPCGPGAVCDPGSGRCVPAGRDQGQDDGERSDGLALDGRDEGPAPGDLSPVPEGSVPSDTSSPDHSIPDAKPQGDIKSPADLKPPPDTAPPADIPCVVSSEVNSGATVCSKQCLSTVNDGDCDGLPFERDPWGASCNTLLFAEEFAAHPASSGTWTAAAGAGWSCGQAELADGQSLELATPGFLPDHGFLVEARFTLGAVVNAAEWRVRIQTVGKAQTSLYTCEMWLSTKYSAGPGLHTTATCSGTWDVNASLPASPGTTYFLQAYYISNGAQVCRLLAGDGALLASQELSACPLAPQPAKRLRVAATGRAAAFQHVRVFQTTP